MIKHKEDIVRLYTEGFSYREIHKIIKVGDKTICKCVKGIRSPEKMKEINRIKQGILTENGRQKLSECGRKAALNSKKFWTKPEKEFYEILLSIGLSVRFPDCLKEIIKIEGDEKSKIYFQYNIQRYLCDFVDIENKVIFKVNGDYWHANPILYNENDLTNQQKLNVKQDINSNKFFSKLGYKVCVIWESEILWNKDLVKGKIWAVREQENPSGLHPETDWFDTNTAYQEDWSSFLIEKWFCKKEKISRTKRHIEMDKIKCTVCNKVFIPKTKKQNHCSKKCNGYHLRKTERPEKEVLTKEIEELGYSAVGRKYGVSDNAVRKWLK